MDKQSRLSFDEIYMTMAKLISLRSTCNRLQVGTVITSSDYKRVLSVGYNGNASGLDNKCDSEEPVNCGCLHSEENAIINCNTSREVEKYLYCTHLPCKMCAKRIINLGNVKKVYYNKDYRIKDSISLFKKVNIEVIQLDIDNEYMSEVITNE